MGVRGFVSHMRSNLNAVGKHFDLETPGQKKRVVVDGNAFAYWVYSKSLQSWICNYVKIAQVLERLLAEFTRVGVVLIFVFDGPTEILKLRSKLTRLSKHAITCRTCPQTFSDTIYPPPLIIDCIKNGLYQFSSSLAAHNCHFFVYSGGEADRDLVAIASEYYALGILSNDSDMLIYKYDEDVDFMPLWSLRCDIANITVQAVKRSLFARTLDIPPQIMWALAALLGHDESPPDVIRRIHLHLKGRKRRIQVDRDSNSSTMKVSPRSKSSKGKKKKKGRASHSFGVACDKKRKERPEHDVDPSISSGLTNVASNEKGDICSIEFAQQTGNRLTRDENLVQERELYWEQISLLCGSRTLAGPCDDIMSSQETLQIGAELLIEATHMQNSSFDVSMCITACLLGLEPEDVLEACMSRPCGQTPCPKREMIGQSRRRWSLCCSNTSKECRRLVSYFKFSEMHYIVSPLQGSQSNHSTMQENVTDDSAARIDSRSIQKSLYRRSSEIIFLDYIDSVKPDDCFKKSTIFRLDTLHLLPWDLQMVYLHRVYMPRVALCDNIRSWTDFSACADDVHEGVYSILRDCRKRVYSFMLLPDSSTVILVREVLFSFGQVNCSDVSVKSILPETLTPIFESAGQYKALFDTFVIQMLTSESENVIVTAPSLHIVSDDKLSIELYMTCTLLRGVVNRIDSMSSSRHALAAFQVDLMVISFVATVLCSRGGVSTSTEIRKFDSSIGSTHAGKSDITTSIQYAIALQWSVIELCVLHAEYVFSVASVAASELSGHDISTGSTVISMPRYMDSDLYTTIYSALEIQSSRSNPSDVDFATTVSCQLKNIIFGDVCCCCDLDSDSKASLVDDILSIIVWVLV